MNITKKSIFGVLALLVVVLVVILLNEGVPSSSSKIGIRIGWQTPWATQGELAQILKKTSVLTDNGLVGDFTGFDSGAPLNEAALSGNVDIIFTADQPAATLLAKDPNWVIIGRLMYNRVSLYVPPKSPINSIADLRGKTVAMPFGAAAQRMALKAEQSAGLDPTKDVKNINIGIYEQSDMVRDPNATKWGTIDAMAGFDPTPAIFEEKGLIRNLSVGKVVSVIVVSKKYITQNPTAPKKFMAAFRGAYEYYQKNITQADQWFVEESKLNITPKALQTASSLEPNLTGSEGIRLDFNEADYATLQEAADFLFDQKLIKQRVIMKDHVDLSYLPK